MEKWEDQIQSPVFESVQLEKVHYHFAENGITYILLKENSHFEMQDTEEEVRMLLERKERLPLRAVVFMEPFVTISSETRQFWLRGKGKEFIKREAVVNNSLGPKIMLMAAKKIYKNFDMEIKFFKNLCDAERWTLNLK